MVTRCLFCSLYRSPAAPRTFRTIASDARDTRAQSEVLRADAHRLVHFSRQLRTDGARLRAAAPRAA